MKHLLILLAIMLILYLVYKNIKIVEGKKGTKNKCSKKSINIECINKEGKKKKKCIARKKKACRPFIAWDGDKYKSCDKCCHDDAGCWDSRCYKCSPGSFRHSSGNMKRGPLKP